jgi:MFS family permease
MNPNLWLVLGTAVFFGLATGIYEYVFPLFLLSRGMTYAAMGGIFAAAGAAMVLVRIYMGGLSDRWGRKHLFGWALVVCGLGTAAPPLLASVLAQSAMKIVRDIAALTRETLFPIVLYEEQRGAFLNFIGKFRGVEFLVQAGGTLLAGVIVAGMGTGAGYPFALYVAGGALVVAAIGWALRFTEHRRAPAQQIITLRELFNFDLHHNLRVVLVAGVVFTFAVMISHNFFMPIFFLERFGISDEVNARLMALHRVTIALPMLLVGNLPIKNLRAWYCWGFVIEGVTMAACAVVPHFWTSAGIFLLHDLIGAGIWVPIQAMIIQRYSRDHRRGIEVGKVLAWTSTGVILGPLAAGSLLHLGEVYPSLAEVSLTFPFLFSGLLMIVAVIPLLWLKLDQPAPAPVAEKA